MRFRTLAVAAALALCSSFPLAAADAPLAFDDIREQQTDLRQAILAAQPPYDSLSQGDRDQLVARQDELLGLIEGKETLLDLDPAGQTEAINSLEWIRAEIESADDDRLVCRREKRVGSNMPTRVCKTVAERRKEREEAAQVWNKGSTCSDGIGCGR